MKKSMALIAALLCAAFAASAQLAVSDLKVNGLCEPMGVEGPPVFSWIVTSDRSDTDQAAYRLSVTGGGRTFCSAWVDSGVSTGVTADFPLQPDTRYDWTLRVRDNHGRQSRPRTGTFHTGVCGRWQAVWIGVPGDIRTRPTPVYFQCAPVLRKPVRSATAYVTAHGMYEASVNGKRVGDGYLTPGWTSYDRRLQYQSYDVTNLLVRGENCIRVVVAPGWWASGMNWGEPEKRFRYGGDLSLLMEIRVRYADGTAETLATGPSWQMSRSGPVCDASIYDGQTIDACREYAWEPASVQEIPLSHIVPSVAEPVRVRAVLKPVRVLTTPRGEQVLDFGQNLVGWERVRLRGNRGNRVVISHAEILDGAGNFYTENLRTAKAQSVYYLSGEENVFEPTLTFYGFRYIRVEGLDGPLNPDDFEAVAVDSGFEQTGHFNCSNQTINQLQSNIYWSFRGNFVDIPTDCPQRDERLGWTGDAQVFFRTAAFNGDVKNFFRKWLATLADDQRESGAVPRSIPDTFRQTEYAANAAGWADCATLIPWRHYEAYGDLSILAAQYGSMKAWADYQLSHSQDHLLNTFYQPFGDWLFLHYANDPRGESAVTSRDLIAQCFMAASLDAVARSAALLGKEADAAFYGHEAKLAREAFCREYVTPAGLVSSDTQTAYVLALYFDMLPESLRTQAAARLVANIARYSDHISTGFLGTPHICEVLSRYGHSDVAYKLLLQKTCPSWIYPISKGATTIWERWNSIRSDGTILGGMNSFNHYSLGAVGDWLYRWAAGLRETSPGYRTFVVDPHPGGDFTFMEISLRSPYGDIAVRWEAEDNRMVSLSVTVPVGTRAEIHCPDGIVRTVGSGKYVF
ncbi:MAG: family 78 glycoside hydrolase catalytic domain [Bacteroidales bacterium]|nr:family 78 glycoside hydrolase catalytic domain [Bacteroidales bacterium]